MYRVYRLYHAVSRRMIHFGALFGLKGWKSAFASGPYGGVASVSERDVTDAELQRAIGSGGLAWNAANEASFGRRCAGPVRGARISSSTARGQPPQETGTTFQLGFWRHNEPQQQFASASPQL